MTIKSTYTPLVLLIIWGIICLVQAYGTELHPDEAYYWVYSQHIAWGHFHQPPMVAIFIKAGYAIFHNELGVRLLFVLAHLCTLGLLYTLIKPARFWLFALVCCSFFLLHASSLLAVPDTVLIFFVTLFLFLLKHYLNKDSIILALTMGVCGGCILLSKYHGGLILIILLLANFQLFKRPSFYIIIFITVALFLPHVFWQNDNDWPAIRFHLFHREIGGYSLIGVLEYLGAQILLLGPAGILLLVLSLKTKTTSAFNKSSKFLLFGLFIFFLVLSFTNRVEANWTAAAYLGLLLYGYPVFEKKHLSPWLLSSLVILSSFFLLLRIEAGTGAFFPELNKRYKYHYRKGWVKAIQKEAQGKPVTFSNSYQDPSIYMFYSGDISNSYNTCISPGNQFDLYSFTKVLDHKSVLMVQNWKSDCDTRLVYNGDDICYRIVDDYRALHPIWFTLSPPNTVKTNDSLNLSFSITNRLQDYPIDLSPRGGIRPEIIFSWIQNGKSVAQSRTKIFIVEDMIGNTLNTLITTPKKPGTYSLTMGIALIGHYPSRNAYWHKVVVVPSN